MQTREPVGKSFLKRVTHDAYKRLAHMSNIPEIEGMRYGPIGSGEDATSWAIEATFRNKQVYCVTLDFEVPLWSISALMIDWNYVLDIVLDGICEQLGVASPKSLSGKTESEAVKIRIPQGQKPHNPKRIFHFENKPV